jgi:hypothetical protein
MLFRPTSLLQHPFPDVRRTVKHGNALRLTCIEKTNSFEIDEIDFLQVQHDRRFAALSLGLDLLQMRDSKFAAEPNPSFGPFNPQRHSLTGSGRRLVAVQVADHSQ